MAFNVIVFGARMVRRNGRHHDQGMGPKNRSAYGRRHMYRSGRAREGNWFARCSGCISLTTPDLVQLRGATLSRPSSDRVCVSRLVGKRW